MDEETKPITPEPESEAEPKGYSHPPVEFQFKKGISGNPGGRPRTKIFTDAIRRYLHNNPAEADKVAKAILGKMKAGDVSAFREVLDRVEGAVTNQVDLNVTEQGIVDRLNGARERLARLKGGTK
jgi:hypothetical protein